MKAIVQDRYGSSGGVLSLREIDRPVVGEDEVLVRVRATSGGLYDWGLPASLRFIARLASVLRKPRISVPGLDLAGQIEAVGRNAARFRIGDEVFGWCKGALAEYVSVVEDALALKPTNLTLEQAAVVPVSGITALQALRDKGKAKPGQKVLIIGASGGVGTFAVQIGKAFGTEVTGVCSTSNLDMVRSIGADHVIDYTESDFTQSGKRFDLVVDMSGNRSLAELRRVLSPRGALVMVGGSGLSKPGYLRGIGRWLKASVLSVFSRQKLRAMLQTRRGNDLIVLKELIESGKITPVISATHQLSEVPSLADRLEQGHGLGKVVITV